MPFFQEFTFIKDDHYYVYPTFLDFLIERKIISVYDPEMTFDQIYDIHFFKAVFDKQEKFEAYKNLICHEKINF